jgi:hypothetical protein
LAQHFSEEDKLLEIDTIVGDGTEHKWTRRPTPQMEALDESGRKAIEKEQIRSREFGIPWVAGQISPIDDLPLTMEEADAKYEREVADGRGEVAMAPRRGRPPRAGLPTASERVPEPEPQPEFEPEAEPEPEPPPPPVYRSPTMIDRSKR